MTAEGYSALDEELKRLKTTERPAVISAISEARAHGDLSENAEYHAAKERQGWIEGRIAEIEDKISRAQVIDVSRLSGANVKFGATVSLVDEDTEEDARYQIVGEHEADVRSGRISLSSPLSRAMIGKAVGDVVEVSTPGGIKDPNRGHAATRPPPARPAARRPGATGYEYRQTPVADDPAAARLAAAAPAHRPVPRA